MRTYERETAQEAMRHTLWLGGALVLAASACGSTTHHGADPTTAPSTAAAPSITTSTSLPAVTTTTVPDPVNIPAKIDVPYVNAVLAQLNHVYGNAQRIEISTKFLPKTIPPLLRAVFADPQYNRELSVFSQALQGNTLSQLKPNAPDPVAEVIDLKAASSNCVEAKISIEDNAAISAPSPPLELYVVLRPKMSQHDPGSVNPTPWAISYELTNAPIGTSAC